MISPDPEKFFTQTTLKRARDIVRRKLARLDDDHEQTEHYISGEVIGTAEFPYLVDVFIDEDYINSECSCPVIENCKHGAALLLLWRQQKQAATPSARQDRPSAHRRDQLAVAVKHDKKILAWLDTLTDALSNVTSPVSSSPVSENTEVGLIYVLKPANAPSGPTVAVSVLKRSRSKKGAWKKGSVYPLDEHYSFSASEFTRTDEAILELLITSMSRYGRVLDGKNRGAVYLSDTLGDYLLNLMLDTGRLFWENEREFAFSAGIERTASVHWNTEHDDAALQLSTNLHDDGPLVLADTQPIKYIDPQRYQLGTVVSDHDIAVLLAASQAPAVPASAAQAISNMLCSNIENSPLPLPAEPSLQIVKVPLICRLRIYSADSSAHVSQWTVQVLMCYEAHCFHVELHPKSSVSTLTLDDGTEVEVTRDHHQEYRQYQFFRRRVSGFEPAYARDPTRFSIADHQPLAANDEERYAAFERLFNAFDTLHAEGFEIVVEAPVSLETDTVTDFDFDLQPIENGWFDLGLQLKHEGTSYDLLPLILTWLERGNRNTPLHLIAEDGRRLKVPADMIQPIASTLLELYDDTTGQVAVTRSRALSLSHLGKELGEAGAQSDWHGDKALLALAKKVERISANQQMLMASAKAPKTLKGNLRQYQLIGMAWLNFLHEAGMCGVLADDMGLGKTIQTLAHVLSLKQRRKLHGPCLVVAPTSVLHNWAREAEKFAPILKTRVWHGADRHANPLSDSDALLVVTSYSLALRDHELLARQKFAVLVLDEAQTIKNPTAKITQSLKKFPVEHRICLTGTPLENHLGELWSLFDFLMPGMLGPQKRFTQHFRTPIEKHGDTDRQKRLNNAIAPFLLRRRKQTVAAELPAKTEIIRKIELDSDQAKLYETIRVGMEKRVRQLLQERGVARSHIQMLDALLKLRQSCCHPKLVKLDSARKVKTSAKTDYAISMIEELINEGRTIILFSQFTQMLDILESEVKKRRIEYVKLTGKTRKRQEAIDAFQSGNVPLFLISLKAGGTGLNLTAADTVIHYDPWWNPAVENQATDRAHRIGQDKPVFVYKLIADKTVEDKIVAMQARKQALADATVESNKADPVKTMSASDILSLFAEDS